MATSELHQKILKEFLNELAKGGYRVFDLEGKIPDGIVIKDNKIYAVEVLGRQYKKGRGWRRSWTIKNKNFIYRMFDGVFIKDFKYPIKIKGGTQ